MALASGVDANTLACMLGHTKASHCFGIHTGGQGMKYPTREIKEKLGIQFKFHFLRHTYGTMMAEKNTPTHLLCNQMGHGNIHVTQKYYMEASNSEKFVKLGSKVRLFAACAAMP